MPYVLIVSNDTESEKTLSDSFPHGECSLLTVPKAAIAIKKIMEKRPDLLLLDVTCHEDLVESFNLANSTETREALRGLPILMVKSFTDEYPFNFDSQDLGTEWFPVSAFLEKPFDAGMLREKVLGLVGKTAKQT